MRDLADAPAPRISFRHGKGGAFYQAARLQVQDYFARTGKSRFADGLHLAKDRKRRVRKRHAVLTCCFDTIGRNGSISPYKRHPEPYEDGKEENTLMSSDRKLIPRGAPLRGKCS